jgi:hypothetical protein
VTIATKSVPVGDYAVFAHVSLWESPGAGPNDVVCQLYNDVTPVDITDTTVTNLNGFQAGVDIPLMGTFSSDGAIRVACSEPIAPFQPVWAGAQIVAIPANGLG